MTRIAAERILIEEKIWWSTCMPKLLERAYAAISLLPKEDQEAIAAMILEEIASEERWQQALAQTPDALKSLADEARGEFRADRTEPFDPKRL
jgi:hypothetical protein